ncbi:MAG: hypothetical protein ABIZ56_04745, partial [Chthoniobacteraceae bacterium]
MDFKTSYSVLCKAVPDTSASSILGEVRPGTPASAHLALHTKCLPRPDTVCPRDLLQSMDGRLPPVRGWLQRESIFSAAAALIFSPSSLHHAVPLPMKKARNQRTNHLRPRMCATQYNHLMLCDKFPEYREIRAKMQSDIQDTLSNPQMVARLMGARKKICTISVVVHVVYKTAGENISAGQIKSQIAVLNRDYSARNPDKSKVPTVWQGLVTDAGVQFKLTTRDPKGKVTEGITRTRTLVDEFNGDDAMKSRSTGGANSWPSDKYLNIW